MILLRGKLTKGKGPCQPFTADDGTKWQLVGPITKASIGDEIFVAGTEASVSPCGAGKTLIVAFSDTKLFSASDPTEQATRDIEVSVTFSTRDDSPTFHLEDATPKLIFDNAGKWRGKYDAFEVTGKLNIVFVSKAFEGQKFDLTISATNPKTGKKKEETFSDMAKKGVISFVKEMDV